MGRGRVTRAGGRRLAVLLGELHAAAQYVDPEIGPRRGWNFERAIAKSLADRGFPVRAVAGGVEVFGTLPLSGLRHQIDAEIACRDADVIGEWKAYCGPVPKNEVLLFKAKTDDFYEAMVGRRARRPLYRFFGIAGDASDELRTYAARNGIGLIERSRWPAPVLADPYLNWPAGHAPGADDIRRLNYLCRSLQSVYKPGPHGSVFMPPPLPRATAEAVLATQDRWSARLDRLLTREVLAA